MTAPRDKLGRPVVVVTGMGIMTSLGAGKADNWSKLVAGESGIRTITRFPIDGLKTTMAGTVDFVSVDPFSSTGLSERMAEQVTQEALDQAGIGAKGDFPGPLFLAVAPVEVEWPQRRELGRAVGKPDFTYDDLLRISGGGKYAAYHHRFMFGSVAAYLAETFGTKGSPISLSTACASGATSIQLGVEAIRRRRPPAPSPRTATVLSWPKAPAPSCWRAMKPQPRAAQRFSASLPAAASSPIPSIAPALRPMGSRSSVA
jgi:3-oxoacyl-[acyl-carrier-protein] synthase II